MSGGDNSILFADWDETLGVERSMPCRLPRMDCMFPPFTPAVSSEVAALLDDAMARNQERDGICAHSETDRPCGAGAAYRRCHLRIARD